MHGYAKPVRRTFKHIRVRKCATVNVGVKVLNYAGLNAHQDIKARQESGLYDKKVK